MADDTNNEECSSPSGIERLNTTSRRPNDSKQQSSKKVSPISSAQRPNLDCNRPSHHAVNSDTLRRTPSTLTPHRPQRPQYSLAGGLRQGVYDQSYVDPRYYEYNPTYRNPKAAPVWGLAKPLPRVVRPGMRRGDRGDRDTQGVVEDVGAEVNAPGTAEAIPQLAMIDEQREEEGKQPVGGQSKNKEQRRYGHRAPRHEDIRLAVREASENGLVDDYGTPKVERRDPMEDWQPPVSPPGSDQFEEEERDLGRLTRRSTFSEPVGGSSGVHGRRAADNTDLEAGQNSDEWAFDGKEAEQYMHKEDDMHNTWATIRARFREPLAECLATMIAVLIGLSTNLSVQISSSTKGTYISANWAWGLGITIGIYIAGGISGGHLNPAISLMLCLYRGFPLRKAGIYIAAQVTGALIAGLLAFGVYKDLILEFDASGGMEGINGVSTSSVDLYAGGTGISFYTQPADLLGPGAAFTNEFLATAILSCAILALGDDSNAPPGAGMHAFIVGLLVTALTMAFGYNTGACLNPARDFGPRLATAMVGYGSGVFTARNAWWFYGAWGATIGGALTGGGIYDIAIFVGGESPINYPRGKRRKVARRVKEDTRKRWWHLRGYPVRHSKRKDGKV